MLKCADCPSWDKETEQCDMGISEMTDVVCLLRNMAWLLIDIDIKNPNDEENGDWWKKNDPSP